MGTGRTDGQQLRRLYTFGQHSLVRAHLSGIGDMGPLVCHMIIMARGCSERRLLEEGAIRFVPELRGGRSGGVLPEKAILAQWQQTCTTSM